MASTTGVKPFIATSTGQRAGKPVEEGAWVPVVEQEPTGTQEETMPDGEERESELFENKNNSETIRVERPEQPLQAGSDKIKKIGKVGRKRKYEQPGIDDIPPVRDVVLYRYKMGRHWPGMSDDMREWYEFYYFTKPNRAERAKDAKDYERHCKAWERGRKWIAEECGLETLGDSGKVVVLRRRANG